MRDHNICFYLEMRTVTLELSWKLDLSRRGEKKTLLSTGSYSCHPEDGMDVGFIVL